MASYHKPKTYRAADGCCICKAKSSSSRFTDSDKYEDEFEQCFQLEEEERTGEICNACVLIVKRFRQLPRGTEKNWAHVVDARAGPGHNTKKMMVSVVLKPTTKKRTLEDEDEERFMKSPKIIKKRKVAIRQVEARPLEARPMEKFEKIRKKRKDKSGVRRREVQRQRASSGSLSGFIDLGYWRRMESCCGLVFVGQLGEVMIDQNRFSACSTHSKRSSPVVATEQMKAPATFVPVLPVDIDSDKSFIDEDDDIDSISFYSDTDSSVSKISKTDLATHTDDEGFEGLFDKTFNKRIKESFANI